MKPCINSKKLTLSVEPKFKRLAVRLSKLRRRSITKLFEDWIEAESLRLSELEEVAKAQKRNPVMMPAHKHPAVTVQKKARRAA